MTNFKAIKCIRDNTINDNFLEKTEYYNTEEIKNAKNFTKTLFCTKCNRMLYKYEKDDIACFLRDEFYADDIEIIG